MTSILLRPWKHIPKRGPSLLPRTCSTKLGDPLLPLTEWLIEETLPFYNPSHFYPVKIGHVYNESRYQVVGKLGYGASSTVWLCRDLLYERKYVALKVSTRSHEIFPERSHSHRESSIYEHLAKLVDSSKHPGQAMIRELHDTFELKGADGGSHQCLSQPVMHMSIAEMMKMSGKPLSIPMLKMVIGRLLTALDFLHSDANVIHTDIKSDNIMLIIEDQSMLERFAAAELESPSPRKIIDVSRVIYQSRGLGPPENGEYGLPILCDLGEARLGGVQSSTPFVQPHIYRAPEVIFEMERGPPMDIWNVACLIWDLFEGKHLFEHIFDSKGHHDPFLHLARMVSLIGSPPSMFIERSETTQQCFDSNGKWTAHDDASVLPTALEDIECRLAGQEKASFINFLRTMLQWLPVERKTARELLEDPWLNA